MEGRRENRREGKEGMKKEGGGRRKGKRIRQEGKEEGKV